MCMYERQRRGFNVRGIDDGDEGEVVYPRVEAFVSHLQVTVLFLVHRQDWNNIETFS